jgi:BlaI family transcriptional regulator, penicillinase repressor
VTSRSTSSGALTRLQQAILDLLWSRGPATAEQVRLGLTSRFPLKDSSVRTLLRRLEARGYVAHAVRGKSFAYHALLPRHKVAMRAVRQIIDRFWSGSVDQFLAGMVDENLLSPREVDRLARLVRRKR